MAECSFWCEAIKVGLLSGREAERQLEGNGEKSIIHLIQRRFTSAPPGECFCISTLLGVKEGSYIIHLHEDSIHSTPPAVPSLVCFQRFPYRVPINPQYWPMRADKFNWEIYSFTFSVHLGMLALKMPFSLVTKLSERL